MKSLLIVVSMLLLAGCLATPVKRTFPLVPADLMEPPVALRPLPADTKDLDQLIVNANHNYSLYHELVIRLEGWQTWYQEQRKIFDSVK